MTFALTQKKCVPCKTGTPPHYTIETMKEVVRKTRLNPVEKDRALGRLEATLKRQ